MQNGKQPDIQSFCDEEGGTVMIILKVILGVVIVAAVFFVLTFLVYFFNLDMKAAAKIMPVISRHYDKVKKEKRL